MVLTLKLARPSLEAMEEVIQWTRGDVLTGNWMACGEGIEGTEQESGTEAQKLPEVSC